MTTDTHIGQRVAADEILRFAGPNGAYAKVPEDSPQYRNGYRWYVRYGTLGSLREGTHTVEEHGDGTITVTPSLVMPSHGAERWHGYLHRGVFAGQFERMEASP